MMHILKIPIFMIGGNMDVKNQMRIHSFETLGAVDGPGIRFVVFAQGCHLKCKYCQNRDTWDVNCGAIYDIKDLVKRIERYTAYMRGNGGITISGGEPLLQPDALITLLKEMKKRKINVAIDTSGNLPITDKIKEVIELADLFLLDIKCINDDICKDLIGRSNKEELEFARYLSDNGKEMWIRQVLIPGYTDKEEDLKKLKEFIDSLETVTRVEILPYHNLGKFKWEEMNIPYEFENVRIPTNEDIRKAKEILGIY